MMLSISLNMDVFGILEESRVYGDTLKDPQSKKHELILDTYRS